jgi:hypothetical protein
VEGRSITLFPSARGVVTGLVGFLGLVGIGALVGLVELIESGGIVGLGLVKSDGSVG